ncbi:MAG: type II toxin-antitoxin system YafQ family toxin [Synergistaceae bacterium]|nr:type II toxin-antitoxin system YafQ family toxin [Synergistaceae bacterium]
MRQVKYKIKWTSRFKKEYKLAKKRGYDMELLKNVVQLIAKGDEQKRLIEEYGDHALEHNWKGHRELHILPDWLLIYYIEEDLLVLSLSRTGTHSDLFGK